MPILFPATSFLSCRSHIITSSEFNCLIKISTIQIGQVKQKSTESDPEKCGLNAHPVANGEYINAEPDSSWMATKRDTHPTEIVFNFDWLESNRLQQKRNIQILWMHSEVRNFEACWFFKIHPIYFNLISIYFAYANFPCRGEEGKRWSIKLQAVCETTNMHAIEERPRIV